MTETLCLTCKRIFFHRKWQNRKYCSLRCSGKNIKIFTDDVRKKISSKLKGRKFSNSHKQNLSKSRKEFFLNGGTTHMLGKHHSKEVKRKISLARTGMKIKPFTEEHKNKLSRSNKGKHNHYGKNNPNWRGGIDPINHKIRNSDEYKLWRIAVFTRDNFTCIWCGQVREGIEADHIKPFSLYPELRFAIDNGRTLCHKCHMTTESYGNYKNRYDRDL